MVPHKRVVLSQLYRLVEVAQRSIQPALPFLNLVRQARFRSVTTRVLGPHAQTHHAHAAEENGVMRVDFGCLAIMVLRHPKSTHPHIARP